jgi:TIGR03009 family protein
MRIAHGWCLLLLLLGSAVAWGQNPGFQPARPNGNAQVVPHNPAAEAGMPGRPPMGAPGVMRTAGELGENEEPVLPCPFPPLDAQQQQYLDRALQAWEQHSAKIQNYSCELERWEYDPIFGPRDPREAKSYSKGILKYAAPDKGLFKIEKVMLYQAPKNAGEQAQFVESPNLEQWICDGLKIFQFEYPKKQLIERTLPKELQGKAIVDGPLPFLFGAKSEKIKARYWLRLITPNDVKNEFWLEAIPKYRRDAANFKMVHVIVDQQDFLPKALQLFDPAYDAQKRQTRTVYTFNNRQVNAQQGLQALNIFQGHFYQPKTPSGWKFIVEPFTPGPGEATAETTPAGSNAKAGASALKLIPFIQKK